MLTQAHAPVSVTHREEQPVIHGKAHGPWPMTHHPSRQGSTNPAPPTRTWPTRTWPAPRGSGLVASAGGARLLRSPRGRQAAARDLRAGGERHPRLASAGAHTPPPPHSAHTPRPRPAARGLESAVCKAIPYPLSLCPVRGANLPVRSSPCPVWGTLPTQWTRRSLRTSLYGFKLFRVSGPGGACGITRQRRGA